MRVLPFLVPLFLMAGCNSGSADGDASHQAGPANVVASSGTGQSDALDALDPAPGQPATTEDAQRPIMQLQVVLERLGFAPGVIDGREGLSTTNALRGYQEASSLPQSGKPDEATLQSLAKFANLPATRIVTIPADFAAGPFAPLPKGVALQAAATALGYETLDEKLAERFHTTPAVLWSLNSGSTPAASVSSGGQASSDKANTGESRFRAGQQVRVPNVGNDRVVDGEVSDTAWRETLRMLGVASSQPSASRLVVSKRQGTLKVYDAADRLLAEFTVTTGSSHDPLPLGHWHVKGVSHNPGFAFDPKLMWDVADSQSKRRLPPGPNGPVGVAWIDLDKPHYGIHGTPDPETIGRAQSHGCVRLANWDVARLAQMVRPGTKVVFEA